MLAAATACLESTVVNVSEAPRRFAGIEASTLSARSRLALENGAALAIALRDSTFRAQVIGDMRLSKLPEHKLLLSELLAQRGEAMRDRLARSGEVVGDLVGRAALGDSALAVYLPIRAQRRSWRGEGDILVAVQVYSRDPIIAFSTDGSQRVLPPDLVPELPMVAITALELSPAAVARARSDSAATMMSSSVSGVKLGAGTTAKFSEPDCDPVTAIIPCDGDASPNPPLVFPPGIIMTQMTVYDKAEPVIRGDPEIEIQISGTVTGRYYTNVWPPPGASFPQPTASDVQYAAGEYLVPIACSGRLAPGTLKQFDYNSEGGAVYNNWVLLEERDEFGVREQVQSPFGTVLFSREASVHPPFVVRVLERDDGEECPTLAAPWLPTFSIGLGFESYPSSRFIGVKGTSGLPGWLSFLGITNENDPMGGWSFSSWSQLENLSPSTLHYGSHVTLRLTNTGVTSSNVPSY
jgi:hypothetical protein